MPVAFRRPGVPTKARETAFVTALVDEGFGIAKQAHPRISQEQVEGERIAAIRAAGAAAFDSEIKAMTDTEFAAWLAAEGLSDDHWYATPFKEMRK